MEPMSWLCHISLLWVRKLEVFMMRNFYVRKFSRNWLLYPHKMLKNSMNVTLN